MSSKRIKNRINSANIISSGTLENYKLMFHKISEDDSGKCDSFFTDNPTDNIYWVIYSINEKDLDKLDIFEARGHGYEKKPVVIKRFNGNKVKAFTYCATDIDEGLKPYTWYKYHVLLGAVENDLPPDYISFIDSFNSVADPDKENAADELSIYLKKL